MALKPAPVAFYPLGDNSSGNPLTQPNEAVEDASVFNFNSSNNTRISLGTAPTLPSVLTLSAWFKKNSSTPDYAGVFGTRNGVSGNMPYILSDSGTEKFRFRICQSDGTTVELITANSLSDDVWYHVVGVADGSNINLYINGVAETPLSYDGTIITPTNELTIGAQNEVSGTNAFDFDGEITNCQLWNTALSSSEVTTLYNSGVPLTGAQPQASNLKAWYKLDQSANWEADSSGAWQIPDAVSAYPQSFSFDGTDDFVSTNFNVDNYTNLTYSVWVNPTSLNQRGGLASLSSVNNFVTAFWDGSGGKFYVYIGNVLSQITGIWSGSKFGTLGQEKWLHIAVVYDGSGATDADRLKVYADGDYVAFNILGSIPTSIPSGGGDLIIGKWSTAEYDGKMSNVMLFNSSLPATGTDSVETLYNNGVPLTTAIATDNLKGWWKLNNTATFSTNWSIPDASGNGNTGTSSGMTEQNLVNNNVSALNGESSGMTSANLVLTDLTRNLPYDSYSFNFDSASSDKITGTGALISGNESRSFSLWYNITSALKMIPFSLGNPDSTIGGTNTQFAYCINRSNNATKAAIFGRGNDTSTFTVPATNDGNWHHLVVTYNQSALNVYLDGNLIATPSLPSSNYATNDGFSIGNWSVGDRGFNGKLSNISVFNEALTSTEVMKLYSNGMPQDLTNFTPAPVAWWTLGSNSFFNGSNFICKDLIGSNDGTSVNAGVDALQGNTPRSEANGTGTNMDIPTNLEGTTKYSSNNSWSINMSESARVADTP
jgi:hypothetical protein